MEEASSYTPSSGRPRWDISMTLAPASLAALMVGSEARMRASLDTLPSLTGTFRSSRIRTRLPARFRSVIFLMAIISIPFSYEFKSVFCHGIHGRTRKKDKEEMICHEIHERTRKKDSLLKKQLYLLSCSFVDLVANKIF